MQGVLKNTDEYLKNIPSWQAVNLSAFRELVHAAGTDIKEEIKWGVPVFIYKGKIIFAMSSFNAHSKYNFIHNGAQLDDSHGLFNNGLDSKKSRSIDLKEGEMIDSKALADLISQSLNT
jgi:hypothetical protein